MGISSKTISSSPVRCFVMVFISSKSQLVSAYVGFFLTLHGRYDDPLLRGHVAVKQRPQNLPVCDGRFLVAGD